jgi:hypothetical protein
LVSSEGNQIEGRAQTIIGKSHLRKAYSTIRDFKIIACSLESKSKSRKTFRLTNKPDL